MSRTLLLFLFFFASALPVWARQAMHPAPAVLKADTGKVDLRSFDRQKMEAYGKEKEFKYDGKAIDQNSLWDRFWKWFWSVYDEVIGKSGAGKWIQYAVMLLLIGFAVYGITRMTGLDLKIFSGKSRPLEVPYTESLENIHEIDFNEQIEAAVSKGNYRLAVRLCYLRTLKSLTDRSLIHWQPEKTNNTYLTEIRDLLLRQQFAELTLSFEYIWYGEFPIDSAGFDVLKESFDQFNQRIS